MSAPDENMGGKLGRFDLEPDRHAKTLASRASFEELTTAILVKLRAGESVASERTIASSLLLLNALMETLDVHGNRFSATRYRDHFNTYYWYTQPHPELKGARVVDLGCGSLNPFATLYLFLMLGAGQGIAIDTDPIQDVALSMRALVDLTQIMVTTPARIIGNYAITREELLSNISSFDLDALWNGNLSGLDQNRLSLQLTPADKISLGDAAADLVVSNSFFEHVGNPEAVILELARITKPGGLGIHGIDGTDHRRYSDSSIHMLDFLTHADPSQLVHGSNRLRVSQFEQLFVEAGFTVLSRDSWIDCDIPEDLRRRIAPPFNAMADEILQCAAWKLVVQRL